jgi:hypothetical protein
MTFASGFSQDHAPGANERDYPASIKDLATHISHTNDIDDVLKDKAEQQRTIQMPEWLQNMTPEEREAAERKLKRKIDFRLLPMVILMYIMNYLDRNNIASARLAGLEDDLGLTSVQYSVSSFILRQMTLC